VTTPRLPDTPPAPIPVDRFRAHESRTPLHRLEKILLAVVAAQLVLLPWMLGGMRVLGQQVSFGLAVIGLVLGLIPRNYPGLASGEDGFRLYPHRRLARFPVFWVGLVFLGYVLTQALNPAWEFQTTGNAVWLSRVDHISWLPAGMSTPFERSSPWRSLMFYTAAWLPVCAVWIGFTRRRTFQHLFTILAANGFVLAGLGLVQRLEDNGKVLWFIEPPASYFVATFFYKNHAAAYFNLILAVTAGMGFWHFVRASRRQDKSSPAGMYAVFGATIAVITLFSFSRTGGILLFAFLLFVAGAFLFHQFRAPAHGRNPLLTGIMLLLLGGFVAYGASAMRVGTLVERFQELRVQLASDAPDARALVREATWKMFRDRSLTGWGAGSYRFYFPVYQKAYPVLLVGQNGKTGAWEHAHNDYLEYLAELGVLGCGLLALLGLVGARELWHQRCWRNPLALLGVGGLALTLAHSWVDFHFQNPAILTTWCVLLFSFARWAELDRNG
jgi:O-antigen ligase